MIFFFLRTTKISFYIINDCNNNVKCVHKINNEGRELFNGILCQVSLNSNRIYKQSAIIVYLVKNRFIIDYSTD